MSGVFLPACALSADILLSVSGSPLNNSYPYFIILFAYFQPFLLYALWELGYDPYVMVYERPTAPAITRQLQRWVNNKRIFHTVDRFDDYIHSTVKKEA